MEVWFVALGRVGQECELRYTEDVSVYVFDALLPHGSCPVIKDSESEAAYSDVSFLSEDCVIL